MELLMHDLRLHQRDNYIRTSNTHVFFGFTEDNIKMMDRFPKADIRVHIFIGNDADISDKLNHGVHHMVANTTPNSKIVLHIPKYFSDFAPIVREMFSDITSEKKLVIITEKSGPSFLIDNFHKYYLDVEYNEFFIRARITAAYHETVNTKGGALQNDEQRRNPEKYKEQIIANFKARTSMGILRGFKSEEDIWNFIIGDTKASKDKDTIKIPPVTVNVTSKDKGEAEETVRNSVTSALKNLGFDVSNLTK